MKKPDPEIQPYVRAQIYTLLYWVQKWLNMIITGVEAVTCTAWLGAAAGLFLLFRLWPGRAGEPSMPGTLLLQLFVPVLGLLAGWWRGRRKHLNLAATAFWLDRSLQSQEIFSAALFCLERGCNGPFDREILARAGTVAGGSQKPRWPLRFLYRRTLLAIAAMLFMVFMPAGLKLVFFGQAPSSSQLPPAAMEEAGRFLAAEEGRAVLPEELAGFLFSHNQELAERAAEALRAGDIQALTNLLREAGEEMAHSPAWQMAAEELEDLLAGGGGLSPEGEYPRREQGTPGSRSSRDQVWDGRPEEDPGTSPETGWIGRAGEDGAGEEWAKTGQGSSGRERGEGDETLPAAFAGGAGEEGTSREMRGAGGLTGGEGEGDAGEENVEVASGEGPGYEEAVITRSAENPVFAYILPDRDPRAPFAEALPPAARAAEEALARAGVPLEYEEYVKLYFQELAKEFE
ncbi:MAG: hypothetical protein GX894_03655 [Clostridia bacterium]|nr:hypothetical protein [Clostridia bacterium]